MLSEQISLLFSLPFFLASPGPSRMKNLLEEKQKNNGELSVPNKKHTFDKKAPKLLLVSVESKLGFLVGGLIEGIRPLVPLTRSPYH